MKFKNSDLKNILFLDIETVPMWANYNTMPAAMKSHWAKKCNFFRDDKDAYANEEERWESLFNSKAGIYAEFARIICISVGLIILQGDEIKQLRLNSYCDEKESKILNDFCDLLDDHFNNLNKHFLCGHNLREFDIPFICRRCLLNDIRLPRLIDISGKRPWQTPHLLDTLEMWKFGDYKNYTSLDLLTSIFNIPSPKDDMDGSMVAKVYWEEMNLDRIIQYCEKDVLSVVQLFLRYQQKALLETKQVFTKSKYDIHSTEDGA